MAAAAAAESQPNGTMKMTESEAKQSNESTVKVKVKHLKYLDFIQMLAIYAIVCFTAIYDYAKENSGPLKPGVQRVENTVKTVIGPVYQKFQNVPFELLQFVDHKVDVVINEIEIHMPSLIKTASSKALTAAQKAPEVARSIASDVQRDGIVNTSTNIAKTLYTEYEPTAKELYEKYEPIAEHYAVFAWQSLNRLPLFPQVAHILIPTASSWIEKYNQAVTCTANKGYPVAHYLPIVPLDRIAKVFEANHSDAPSVTGVESVAFSQ